MDWTKDKTLLLIQEYRKRPGLWDMSSSDYRKKELKRKLLEEVSQQVGSEYQPIEIEKKFHTLRTQYHREIRNHSLNEQYKTKWFAFPHLQFLSSPNACRGSKRNVVIIEPGQNQYEIVDCKVPNKYLIKGINTTAIQQEDNSKIITTEPEKPNIITKIENMNNFKKELELSVNNNKTLDEKYIIKNIEVTVDTSSGEKEMEEVYEEEYEEQTDLVNHEPEKLQSEENMTITDDYQNLPTLRPYNKPNEDTYCEGNTYSNTIKENNTDSSVTRDEASIFGEYIANELRFLTNRDILVNTKYKINLVIYEACKAQLQKK